jgi:hypothetical protein
VTSLQNILENAESVCKSRVPAFDVLTEESLAPRAICAQSSLLANSDPSLNGVTSTNYARCYYDEDFWIQDADDVLKELDAVVCIFNVSSLNIR